MLRARKKTSGGAAACQRCRRRKQKCDQRYPQCSNCATADVPCLTYHPGKQADIPRDYVSRLENQIAELVQEVQDLRERVPNSSRVGTSAVTAGSTSRSSPVTSSLPAERESASTELPLPIQDLVTSVRNVVADSPDQSRFLGQSSGISFAKMVMSAIRVDDLSPPLISEQQVPREISLSAPAKASLPPRHVADHLVSVYFQYRNPHLPILDRSRVNRAIEAAYQALETTEAIDELPETDLFTAYVVFAIALVDVPHNAGGRPGQSEGCFRSALGWVEKTLTYSKSDIETLRVVLLLAQFVALSPSRGSLWHLTGFALRLCIDIGLHWENGEECLSMDPGILDDRRRLWHSTYHFDRLLCINLGRPVGILDESTRVELPNPWRASGHGLLGGASDFDVHTRRAHNHLFTLARLESEIRHVQHGQVWNLKLACPRPDWTLWLADVQPRLQEWYATIPEPSKAHPCSIFAIQAYWEVMYNNALLMLFRPHSVVSGPSTEELIICFEASCKVIAGIKTLQREGRVEMLWKSVHHLFLAGLGVIYGLWHSKEIRDQNSIGQCISTLQSCASTLSAMSQTFQGATGCRNAFESLSSATIDWLVTQDIEEVRQNRLEFEKHVRELMIQLQLPQEGMTTQTYPRGDNVSAILSAENFDVGEALNAAAQWPYFGDFHFDMGDNNAQTDDAAFAAT